MKENFYILATLVFAGLIAVNPSLAADSARNSLSLCAGVVVPSLFPFFVCSFMLTRLNAAGRLSRPMSRLMRPLFGLGGNASLPLMIGVISGYPVGAKTVSDMVLQNTLTKKEGEKLLAFCNNCGPLFVLGAVGSGMLRNPQLGRIIYASHLFSALSVGLIFRNIKCESASAIDTKQDITQTSVGAVLSEAVTSSATSVLGVCGYITIFGIIISIMTPFAGKLAPVLCAVFEPTNACSFISENIGNIIVCATAISAVLGWAGISVHMQVLGCIKKAGLSAKYYFLGKLAMMVISPVYTLIFLRLFGRCETTFAQVPVATADIYLHGFVFSVLIPIVVIGVILILNRKEKLH